MIKYKDLITKYPKLQFDTDTFDIQTKVYDFGTIEKTISPKPLWIQSYSVFGELKTETYNPQNLIKPDADVSIECFWYWGEFDEDFIEQIEQSFETKDYDLYLHLLEQVREGMPENISYGFPTLIHFSIDGLPIGMLEGFDEFLFKNLDYQESECG